MSSKLRQLPELPERLSDCLEVEYADDRDGFKQYIRDCIAALREAGK